MNKATEIILLHLQNDEHLHKFALVVIKNAIKQSISPVNAIKAWVLRKYACKKAWIGVYDDLETHNIVIEYPYWSTKERYQDVDWEYITRLV